MTRFREAEFYRSGNAYTLLPFRFMRWSAGEVLLVNDVGEHAFIPAHLLDRFIGHTLDPDDPSYLALKTRHFLHDSTSPVPLELLATKYRTKKSHLEGFTSLHLFVVTLRCDHSCGYCQVSRVTEDRLAYDMTVATAERSIDLMFRSPAPALKVEFQGGEALLNFDLIRHIVLRVEDRAAAEGREVEFVIATNLVPLTNETLDFCGEHSIHLSTSLDGPAFIHDRNRPRRGAGSHALVLQQLEKARTRLGHDRIAALMTATPLSLRHPREIIDEYVRLGFEAVFLRWVSPYGFARRTGLAHGYAVGDFLDFYRAGLDYIVEVNRRGVGIVEVYTQILLRRILTPFATGFVDLQSPAGAVLNVVAYNYDGRVYASDEARMLAAMGDDSFLLGHVDTHSYEDMFGGQVARLLASSSVLEALPGCSWCAFAPFCGADPISNWATQGDVIGHRPTSDFCGRNMGVFRELFGRLRTADPFEMELFAQWATA